MPFLGLAAQDINLIGEKEKDIREYVGAYLTDFSESRDKPSPSFKYLKLVDQDEMRTLYFFLDKKNVCKSIRFIGDWSLWKEMEEELNARFDRGLGEGEYWLEKKKRKTYRYELDRKEWFFVLNIKPEE